MKLNNLILIIVGVWLIISPWILGFSELNLIVWNVIISGILIVISASSESIFGQ